LSDHLTAEEVDRFVRGRLAPAKRRKALRHLLRGCEECRGRLRPLLVAAGPADGAPRQDAGARYDAPMARALAAVKSNRPEAPGVDRSLVDWGLELMRAHPQDIGGLTDEQAEMLGGRPMLHICLQLGFEERYRNPRRMFYFARMAWIAATHLDPAEHDPAVIADEQALAWAELGNAHRVNDELAAAAAALRTAENLREKGTGNSLLLARIADLKASLLAYQRWLPDACELLALVSQIYLKAGDDHLAGRALVSQGIYTNYEGEPREALGLLERGLALLDRERDPELMTAATESILWVMVECGEYRAAAEILLESGLREALAGQTTSLAKLRWLEGRIFAGLRKDERAEVAFREAREGFLQENQRYHAAIVGLDLAEVWLRQGKRAEVKALADEMLATFERLDIQREAVRAMDYLARACRMDLATPRVARHVSHFLKDLEREPQLRFRMP